jgi:hypothetical protein
LIEWFVLDNIEYEHLASQPIIITRVKHGQVTRNVAKNYNLCHMYNGSTGYCENEGKTSGFTGWPGGFSISDSYNAQVIFEGNTITDGRGEGLNCLRSSNVIFKGNKVGNVLSTGIYLDMCSNAIIENNIVWGDSNTDKNSPAYKKHGSGGWGQNKAFAAFSSFQEWYIWGGDDSVNNIFRNNLAGGYGACFDSGQYPESKAKGLKVGLLGYHNTCIGNWRSIANAPVDANTDRVVIQNNIFQTNDNDSVWGWPCLARPVGGSVSYNNNFWKFSSGNTSIASLCRGSSDKLNVDPEVVNSVNFYRDINSAKIPNGTEWALKSTSPARNAATPIDTSHHKYLEGFDGTIKFNSCDSFHKGVKYDFFCKERDNTPNAGAIE